MDVSWITNHTNRPFYVRKGFELKEKPVRAELSACGLGQFAASLNGNRITAVLEPPWTDYNKAVYFRRYDVTEFLSEGKNALLMEVGNGWYNWDQSFGYSFHFPEFMPPNPNPYREYGRSLCAWFELRLEYGDKTVEAIRSDASCRVKPHGVKHSNVYGSEEIEGKDLVPLADRAEYDDSAWDFAAFAEKEEIPKGALEETRMPEIRKLKTYEAKLLHEVNGRKIYDLGQNISGILEAEVIGKAGTVMEFYPAEKLDENGGADQMAKNWMMIDNVIRYVIAEENTPETVTQYFTYMSGRYLAVKGEGEILSLRASAISSAWKQAGTFHCDDERYNRIYDMIEKTVEANMLSVHTDCPTIERFAWQEPNHLMAPAIFFMKDSKALWEKFLKDLRIAQHTDQDFFRDFEGNPIPAGDGLVPSQAPCYIPNVLPVPGMGSFYDIIPWGSTCILGTWWHYLFYGDRSIIEDNYETGMKYLRYLKTKVNADGFINHGLGDWGNPENRLARENIETAFLYADTVTLQYFAEILGKKEDERELSAYAESVRNHYNAKLLRYDEKPGGYRYFIWNEGDLITQASQALPLFFGMVPKEKESDVVKAFRFALEEKQCFMCGEVSLPYVISIARQYGMNDLIAAFVTRKSHPSYYAFILDGETTLGEYWENNPRSHCHDMMGHIIEWYYSGIAGIRPVKPGFAEIKIDPYLPEGMNRMACSYETGYGTILVHGCREDGKAVFTAEVPSSIRWEAAEGVRVTESQTG